MDELEKDGKLLELDAPGAETSAHLLGVPDHALDVLADPVAVARHLAALMMSHRLAPKAVMNYMRHEMVRMGSAAGMSRVEIASMLHIEKDTLRAFKRTDSPSLSLPNHRDPLLAIRRAIEDAGGVISTHVLYERLIGDGWSPGLLRKTVKSAVTRSILEAIGSDKLRDTGESVLHDFIDTPLERLRISGRAYDAMRRSGNVVFDRRVRLSEAGFAVVREALLSGEGSFRRLGYTTLRKLDLETKTRGGGTVQLQPTTGIVVTFGRDRGSRDGGAKRKRESGRGFAFGALERCLDQHTVILPGSLALDAKGKRDLRSVRESILVPELERVVTSALSEEGGGQLSAHRLVMVVSHF